MGPRWRGAGARTPGDGHCTCAPHALADRPGQDARDRGGKDSTYAPALFFVDRAAGLVAPFSMIPYWEEPCAAFTRSVHSHRARSFGVHACASSSSLILAFCWRHRSYARITGPHWSLTACSIGTARAAHCASDCCASAHLLPSPLFATMHRSNEAASEGRPTQLRGAVLAHRLHCVFHDEGSGGVCLSVLSPQVCPASPRRRCAAASSARRRRCTLTMHGCRTIHATLPSC